MSPSHLLGESRPDTVAYTGPHPLLTVDSVVQVTLPISQMRGQKLRRRSPMWLGGGDSCAWKPGCLTLSTTLCITCHYLDLASGCGYQPGYPPHLLAPCSDLRAVPRGLSASQAKGCGAMNAESGGHIPGGRPASHPGLPDTEGVPGM